MLLKRKLHMAHFEWSSTGYGGEVKALDGGSTCSRQPVCVRDSYLYWLRCSGFCTPTHFYCFLRIYLTFLVSALKVSTCIFSSYRFEIQLEETRNIYCWYFLKCWKIIITPKVYFRSYEYVKLVLSFSVLRLKKSVVGNCNGKRPHFGSV